MSDYVKNTFYKTLSKRLSSVLEDIGVSEATVLARRESFLLRETNITIKNTINGQTGRYYHFGSQSEGTTTPGLQSDMDLLVCNNSVHVMISLGDWRKGMENVLMVKEDDMNHQQYLLQIISPNCASPETELYDELSECYKERIVLSSGRCIAKAMGRYNNISGSSNNAGPSASWSKDVDFVQALGVSGSLQEVTKWIDRIRPGHWPTKELLSEARDCMCFLVPVGHPFSKTKHIEWRLSPNLIERNLMFNLNVTQIKCYIVLKMIKKSLFNSVVDDGITSFHCKTVLFYTLERTPLHFWKEQNLAFLLKQCLHTLKRMLKIGLCPHYIISGVNLFEGKLSRVQCRKLHTYVMKLLRNDLDELVKIGIDNLGDRLMSFEKIRCDFGLSRDMLNACLLKKLDYDRISYRFYSTNSLFEFRNKPVNVVLHELVVALHALMAYRNGSALESRVSSEISRDLLISIASVQSSICIENVTPLLPCILECFKCGLQTDVASSRLKLASILLCSGHLDSAAYVLKDVKRRMSLKGAKFICRCRRGHEEDKTLLGFAIFTPLSDTNIVLCVRFSRQELHCVPPILLFEMKRGITEDDIKERNLGKNIYMEDASVDAGVFLYYLQYLTYGGLKNREQTEMAYVALQEYIIEHEQDMYHTETGLNLLGHCAEMECDFEMAADMFRKSVEIFPTNNAAHWHILRCSDRYSL
ncbi:uncharacterized protein LOC127834958 [Dreissena polymorpha]|uniref:Mab-21-like HhH/H2TH-like domain-containing protein n=1 Tax=Dreissena polymorpha TaxID=45954 RepID=A0A9D4JGB3_DREPO|nr:uncharacterized protein LOC127834958 [Dreissena polymorpha]KAH3807678.1 hypothetical protein DPMN_136025 [Dreissena polymorpha]